MIQRGIATFTLDYGKCPKWLFERILSVPVVPLENYLLKLKDDNSDTKESSVYIIGAENLISSIWTELINLYPRSLHYNSLIRKKLGIHPQGFYAYKNGKKAISIQMLYALLLTWKEYCHKTDSDLKKKWDETYQNVIYFTSKRRKPIKLPRCLNPKLSYLIGWICGDGNLAHYGNHYMLKISEKSVSQLEFVLKPLFKDLFGIEPPIYHIYEGGYALQFNSKPLFRFITKVLNLKVGEVPEYVFKLDNENKAHFLSGVFDAEGYVCKNRYRLTISQAKKIFLFKIQDLFNNLGIKFNGPTTHTTKLGTWYTIRLEKKSEILNFVEQVGSYHIDKNKKIEEMIKRIKTN